MKSQLEPLQLEVAFEGVVQETHALPQSRKFALQAMPQNVPSQVAAPLGGVVQAEHDEPQLLTELLDRHWLPQRWYPLLQAKSQEVPEQICTPLTGVLPHDAQAPAHKREPMLHESPQENPSQVAMPLAEPGQAVHEAPQLAVALFERHWLPQRW